MRSRDDASADRPHKLQRLRRIAEDRGADAIRLTSAAALAWLFDGARTAVPLGGAPVFSATVDREGGIRVTALANEADRLAEEELAGVDEWEVIPWHAPLDTLPPGALAEAAVAAELRDARASLLPAETARYRSLGRDTAEAVTRVLTGACPDWTERQLAGRLARAAYEVGAEPAVALVAGAARARVQHPIPTDEPLGDRFLAVVTFVRDGLHASMSRWATFRDHDAWRETEAALREVEADAFAATRRGRALADALRDIAAAYAHRGFGDDAWRAHHQGGPTGYAGRDPKAHPSAAETLRDAQAFAWNPWVPGAKLEDTVIATAGGIEVLTRDPAWPTTEVRGLARPLPLPLD